MYHKHPVYDTDLHLVIDPVTRDIKNTSGKTVLMQHDHNSERFTFEIPRYIDGHDMSICNVVEFHYINIESAGEKQESKDIYIVNDLQVHPDDENIVVGSWLVSHNATKYDGSLNFIIRFACVSESTCTIQYQWFTNVYSGLRVSKGIYNTDIVIGDDTDILSVWKQEINAMGLAAAGEAKLHADIAMMSADRAQSFAKEAEEQVNIVKEYSDASLLSKSYAMGDTGIREDEDTNNSKFYSECAENLVSEALNKLQETSDMIVEMEKQATDVSFELDLENGTLEYSSLQYVFSTDHTTGNLLWEVK